MPISGLEGRGFQKQNLFSLLCFLSYQQTAENALFSPEHDPRFWERLRFPGRSLARLAQRWRPPAELLGAVQSWC